MPNAKVLSEKQAIVETLTSRLKEASAGIVVDYRGITVAEDTALRTEMRKNDVEYSVVKNTLLRFAANNAGLEELDSVLNGTTSLATTTADPIAPFRIVKDYASKMSTAESGPRFVIKAAFMDGKMLSESECSEIAALPSKDALYAKVLGTMLAPITSLAVVLNQIAEKGGASAAAPAAEEAAAEAVPEAAPEAAVEAAAEAAPAAEEAAPEAAPEAVAEAPAEPAAE